MKQIIFVVIIIGNIFACNMRSNKEKNDQNLEGLEILNEAPDVEDVIGIEGPLPVLPIQSSPQIVQPLPPAPGPVLNAQSVGFGGGGGGGHGHISIEQEHKKKPEEKEPEAICGNGIQEVKNQAEAKCPHKLYATALNDNGGSSLYAVDPHNGEAKLIGDITADVSIRGEVFIDFSPQGQLYGVSLRSGIGASFILMSIDCKTATATFINHTGVVPPTLAGSRFTDISFDSHGQLWGYVKTLNNTDNVGTIFIGSLPMGSSYTQVGLTGIIDAGNALGSFPFPETLLFDAGTQIFKLSQIIGLGIFEKAIEFPEFLNESPFINSMDADFFNNKMYASIVNGEDSFVGTLNLETGQVSLLNHHHPKCALNGLHGLAFNRVYEECDPNECPVCPPLPEGTSCNGNCLLRETDCADGIDNNSNGLIDCADPDCEQQRCESDHPCTTTDGTCVNGECQGDPLPAGSPGSSCTLPPDTGFAGICAEGHFLCNAQGQEIPDSCTPNIPNCAIVFTSSLLYDGNLGASPDASGMSGAAAGDAICNTLAAAAGLPTNFVALLSDSTGNAITRLTGDGNWYLLDGTFIATRFQLFNTGPAPDGPFLNHAIDRNENNELIDSPINDCHVWTGSNPDGSVATTTCSDWTSNTPATSGDDIDNLGEMGLSSAVDSEWVYESQASCDNELRLYCFQNI